MEIFLSAEFWMIKEASPFSGTGVVGCCTRGCGRLMTLPKQNIFFSEGTACGGDETKLWLSLSRKQRRSPCYGPPPVYPYLSTRLIGLLKMSLSIGQSG